MVLLPFLVLRTPPDALSILLVMTLYIVTLRAYTRGKVIGCVVVLIVVVVVVHKKLPDLGI